jgi:hypothetical protein
MELALFALELALKEKPRHVGGVANKPRKLSL